MDSSFVVWLMIAVALGIVESLTVSLISIWMAVGALAAGIVAALGGNGLLQMLVFLVVSAVLLVLTVPISKKLRKKNVVSTNADRFVGEEGIVVVKIEPIENVGQVKVLGQVWSAISFDRTVIEIGEKVVVESIEGVRVIVKRVS